MPKDTNSPSSPSTPSVGIPHLCTAPPTTPPLPDCAHRLLLFFTTALHRHDLIFTDTNRHHVEQWVELLARFYLYDTTPATRHATYTLLQRHHTHVWKNAQAVMSFEQLLRHTRTPKMAAFEQQLHNDWTALTRDLRQRSKRPSPNSTRKTKPKRRTRKSRSCGSKQKRSNGR